jgi:hypothetical protein
MKALLATALLLGLSSFTAAQAEWEILDPHTAVGPVTAPAPATSVAVVTAGPTGHLSVKAK